MPDAWEEDVFVFPASFVQQQLWLLDQLAPGSPFYNVPVAFHLRGRLDTVALEQSLNEIIRRHETLRTTFAAVDGRPVQVITPSLAFTLPMVDLQGLSEAERQARAHQLVTTEARRPFDLSRGPLLRATLL